MKKSFVAVLALVFVGMLLSGYQCSSTELTSAKLYIQQGNYDKALEALNDEVTKNPQSAEGYYYLGVVHSELGNIEDALGAFSKSTEISPQFEKDVEMAKISIWADSFNKGVQFFNRANKAEAQDTSAMFYDKAINSFENAILAAPDSADTYTNLAYVYLSTNRYEEAIDPLQALVDHDGGEAGYALLGEVYYTLGMNTMKEYNTSNDQADSLKAVDFYNSAIKTLEEGRDKYPNNSDILLYLSNSYIGANKVDVAIEAFKLGVQTEPDNKFYRFNYGTLLLQSDQFEEAAEQFEKAIEIDPEYENALYNVGVTYVKWGSVLSEEAEERDEEAVEAHEKYKQALPKLEKYLEVTGGDAAVYELLGKVYGVLGMIEEAEEAYNKADELR